MSPFLRRVLISVLPTMAMLAMCGYGVARITGACVATERDNGEQLSQILEWRLPFSFAAWGGGLVFLMELIRQLWAKPKLKPTTDQPTRALSPEQEAEQLLLQLLEQSESAQTVSNIPLDQTPPPAALPLPVPEFGEPTTTS